MKFMLLIYNDGALLDAVPADEADGMMRDCFAHTDELRGDGHLIESQMLHGAERAKSVRIRNGRLSATDGPFAEAKEVLGGYWMIEVKSREEAIAWASKCPASENEIIEIRQVQEMDDWSEEVQEAMAGLPELRKSSSR